MLRNDERKVMMIALTVGIFDRLVNIIYGWCSCLMGEKMLVRSQILFVNIDDIRIKKYKILLILSNLHILKELVV